MKTKCEISCVWQLFSDIHISAINENQNGFYVSFCVTNIKYENNFIPENKVKLQEKTY